MQLTYWHLTYDTIDNWLTYNRQLTVNQHDWSMSIVLKSFSEKIFQTIVLTVQIGFKCFACTIRFTVNSTNDWKQKWTVMRSNYFSRQFKVFWTLFWKIFSFVGSLMYHHVYFLLAIGLFTSFWFKFAWKMSLF